MTTLSSPTRCRPRSRLDSSTNVRSRRARPADRSAAAEHGTDLGWPDHLTAGERHPRGEVVPKGDLRRIRAIVAAGAGRGTVRIFDRPVDRGRLAVAGLRRLGVVD